MKSGAVIAALLVLLAACTPRFDVPELRERQAPVAMLPPESLGETLSLSQVVKGELAGAGRSLRFELEVTERRLVLAGLTHAGIPVFTLVQSANGTAVEMEGPGAEEFDPVYLLSDIKFCYWPLERLNLALGPKRLRMEEETRNGKRLRLLKDEMGNTLLRITYPHGEGGEIVLRRFDLPYRLRIRTLGTAGAGA